MCRQPVIRRGAIVVAPQYFGTVGYYALTTSYEDVYIDCGMRADKRFKSAHRCSIVDCRDTITLTVPVSHPHGAHSWDEVAVSTHGHWWTVHLNALESAYGRTPFFEFYIDKFATIFDGDKYLSGGISVAALDRLCDEAIRSILAIGNRVAYISDAAELFEAGAIDMRHYTGADFLSSEYYQLRADRLGFRQAMSVLDLIFNMGPEAALIVNQLESIR